MELIIGGAYQGKLTYAVSRFGLDSGELCELRDLPADMDAALEKLAAYGESKRCFFHLEALTRRFQQTGRSADELIRALELLPENAIIISREIGCGIVPLDAGERAWREMHGTVLAALSRRAERVVRIFCGLEEALK